jgi:misacylated tRNA(Ala) deacylase
MTQDLFRQDAYLTECTATVTAVTGQGLVLDRTVFYPLGGGQAGDAGVLVLAGGGQIAIADTRKGKDAEGQSHSRHRACAGAWAGGRAGCPEGRRHGDCPH